MDTAEIELISRAKGGDAVAFALLYDAYLTKMYRYVFYRIHHKETAEDLTSTVFLKAFEEIRQFKQTRGTFSAWLYRVAHNTLVDHFRARKSATNLEDVWDTLAAKVDLPRDVDTAAALAQVQERLSTLPAETREIVLLRLWDDYSYKEIAEMTGKSESACKMQVSRAMKTLRGTLPLFLLLATLLHDRL